MTFEYRDPDGDTFTARPTIGTPTPAILLHISPTPSALVPLDRVEEVIAGIRDAARTAAAIDTGSDRAQHACTNCDGIDPASCLTNPGRAARQTTGQDDTGPTVADAAAMLHRMHAAAGLPTPAVDHIDHWELCPSCGRHVIDAARQTTGQDDTGPACAHCQGTGADPEDQGDYDPNVHMYNPTTIGPCPECHGTGKDAPAVGQPAEAHDTDRAAAYQDVARRANRRLAAVERLISGRPGYHQITVKELLTAMSDATVEDER